MCATDKTTNKPGSIYNSLFFYALAIGLAFITSMLNIDALNQIAITISDITIKIFRCLSLPLISLSIIATIISYKNDQTMALIGKKTIFYTLCTTIVAASVSCVLYILIKPGMATTDITLEHKATGSVSYLKHLSKLVPSNLLEPYLEHNVLGVLVLSITFAFMVRLIPSQQQRDTISNLFQGLHSIFMLLAKFVVRIVPIALYGFITVTLLEFKQGINFTGIGKYLIVVVAANMVQGLIILPLWLYIKGIQPVASMHGMLAALSLAFFSKSSASTLPVTITCAVNKLCIRPQVANFVLPLCTTINMNGCAAFIFATVIFVMQNQGIEVSFATMLIWILISTVAAIGNAGVPMGCFFLSASLLSSMDLPITLMGIILPFYSVIDMIETALNVWSDACVTKVIDKTTQEN